ncbi:Com family DNA-binding transcriptional regulator [Moraxella nonliquefaciens]|uniref:DNA-directed RNA polymerase II subunit n=1 Tax=Myoviridae sp. ctwSu1 TaxID=2825207 RepID=A0A8S5U193_9CAUD|nr:Com family DNA-binding transcriptional regulator [Moraxella lacunata]MDI4500822.1 Com family DNA-binding transcriptional regulator [Moraxella nonliquefaciens]MDI4507239.1 Com family DNA-binding transcriptional regulator [Moraxella lacunata]DAF88206.1 MAG TPA: DNA-directed RNA polymerase II subunit [Myoviridae sp. ctwSu1]
MRFLFCQNCNKKLLQINNFDKLSIKCTRCKQINTFSNLTYKP